MGDSGSVRDLVSKDKIENNSVRFPVLISSFHTHVYKCIAYAHDTHACTHTIHYMHMQKIVKKNLTSALNIPDIFLIFPLNNKCKTCLCGAEYYKSPGADFKFMRV